MARQITRVEPGGLILANTKFVSLQHVKRQRSLVLEEILVVGRVRYLTVSLYWPIVHELILGHLKLVDTLNQQSCAPFPGKIVRESVVHDLCTVSKHLILYLVIEKVGNHS